MTVSLLAGSERVKLKVAHRPNHSANSSTKDAGDEKSYVHRNVTLPGMGLEADPRGQFNRSGSSAFRRLQPGQSAESLRVDSHVWRFVVAMIQKIRDLRPKL